MKNTKTTRTASLADTLENFIVATTPGGIEAQEKRGQIEQSFAETLPIKGTAGANRPQLESLGFKFGENADDLFVNVQFPKGWRKQPTDHSMWSNLLDDKGRVRGMIFYKAAFYDRSAHCSLSQRYNTSAYSNGSSKDMRWVEITDCGKPFHTIGEYKSGDYQTADKLKDEANKWLNENKPEWQSANAYWD